MSDQPVVLGDDAPLLEVMSTMRAMRRLKPDPVPRELLEKLVEAATWAPSGGNAQAYHYVVVDDREQMRRLADPWAACYEWYVASVGRMTPAGMDEAQYARMVDALTFQRDHFAETPAVIVPCYDNSRAERFVREHLREAAAATRRLGARRALIAARSMSTIARLSVAASVYPGVQNLLLAARANGLGATLTTWHLLLEAEFKEILGVPGHVSTFAVIPVGWPRGRMGPVRRRPAAEAIHRDRW